MTCPDCGSVKLLKFYSGRKGLYMKRLITHCQNCGWKKDEWVRVR